MVSFYGGAPGKQGLYYIPYRGDGTGVPVSVGPKRGSGEIPLPVPGGIVTASEPNATLRRLLVPDHSVGTYGPGGFVPTSNDTTPVVDMVYTGVLRNTQTPDLFLGRYKLQGAGGDARLTLAALPQIDGEQLVQQGRELVWRSRHIGWYVRGRVDTADDKYAVENLRVQVVRNNVALYTTADKNWQYDSDSKLWVQVLRQPSGGVLYIYVDSETGEVRFRGTGEPQSTDKVQVSYQPTTYRLTPDAAGDGGAFVTNDNRLLPATPSSQIYRHLQGGAPAALLSKESDPRLSGLGRQWVLWSKGAQPNRPARLYFAARRMGIDLRSADVPAVGRLTRNESIRLGQRDAQGNQMPVINVSVAGVGDIPFDVDFATGRVFVDPLYEGLPATVSYSAVQGTAIRTLTATGRLGYIEELAATDTYSMGLQAPMQQTINEGQIYSFVDLYNYDPAGLNQLRSYGNARIPAYQGDPTLQPGKLWMFWTSSRARNGQALIGGNLVPLPSGFDLFYQTIAPRFESPSFAPGQ